MKDSKQQLIEDLLYADSICNGALSDEYLQNRIFALKNITQIHELDNNRDDPIWKWLPAIVFGVFGLDDYKKYRQNRVINKTFMMIPPVHKPILNKLSTELLNEGYDIKISEFIFDEQITARIYGGFPWYRAYLRASKKFNCIGQNAITIAINTTNTLEIDKLLDFKNVKRDTFKKALKLECPDLEYDGIINAFHSPNHIENERHLIAVHLIDKIDKEMFL